MIIGRVLSWTLRAERLNKSESDEEINANIAVDNITFPAVISIVKDNNDYS